MWLGDDDRAPLAIEIARELRSLADSGVDVYFLCGNRDFLLGDDYCRQAGMLRLEEPVILAEPAPPIALLHGDSLCTDDHDYQRFRARVRNPHWQARALSRPLWWRRILARMARRISAYRNRGKPEKIMDVNPEAVIDTFRRLGVERIIHGHTHRPNIHELQMNERSVTRIVLGDWHAKRGTAVRLDQAGIELLEIRHDHQGEIQLKTLGL